MIDGDNENGKEWFALHQSYKLPEIDVSPVEGNYPGPSSTVPEA